MPCPCARAVGVVHLDVTATLATLLAPSWPGLAQVCRLTRERIARGKTSVQTVYVITSLTPDEAGPERLLQLARDHWGIENKLHCVRHVTCRDDQARTNVGHAPQVLAALRNTTLTLLRRPGYKHFVPAWFARPGSDRRRLGIAVRDLRLNGRRVPPAAFGTGWHTPEAGWRWTDGNACLVLPPLRRPAVLGIFAASVDARYRGDAARGGAWHDSTVRNLLARAEA